MQYNHFCSTFMDSGSLDIVDIKKSTVKLTCRLVAQANSFMGGVSNEKFGLLVLIVCLLFSISCSQDEVFNIKTETAGTSEYTVLDAYNTLGDVNKIYTSSKGRSLMYVPILEEKTSARFFSGQKIDDFRGYQVIFDACIVEYNSIDPVYLEYVESLENNNALMHQNYEGFSKDTIDPEKKYVEFASFYDVNTGEVLFHEIRIFFGNFMETYKNEFWYAKSVLFSPDMQIDVDKSVNVLTGESETYSPNFSPTSIKNPGSAGHVRYEMREVETRTDLMLRLGDISRVFAWFSNDEFDYIRMFGGDEILAECYLVELNNLSDEVLEKLESINSTSKALHQREWTIVSLEGKEYVEVIYYNNVIDSSKSFIDLRLRTEKMEGTSYGYYTEVFSLE